MDRPKIIVEKSGIDYLMEILGILIIIAMFIYNIINYSNLPERIPSHFDVEGNVDSYGDKATIWILPVISLLLFISLYLINKYPHLFNYPVEITVNNAKEQYLKATRLIRYLNTLIAFIFAFINYKTIQIALGNAQQLGNGFMFFLIAGLFGGIVIYFIFSKKHK